MIQQEVAFILNLKPDGTSTSFQFDLSKALGVHVPDLFSGGTAVRWPFVLLNADAIPDAVEVDAAIQSGVPLSGVSASVARRTITVSFASAPSAGSDITLTLSVLFNG